MKNTFLVLFTLIFLVPFSASAQMEIDKSYGEEDSKKVMILKKNDLKGPNAKNKKFKNANITFETVAVVKDSRKNLMGPKAKNYKQKHGEASSASHYTPSVESKRKLVGPNAKNRQAYKLRQKQNQ